MSIEFPSLQMLRAISHEAKERRIREITEWIELRSDIRSANEYIASILHERANDAYWRAKIRRNVMPNDADGMAKLFELYCHKGLYVEIVDNDEAVLISWKRSG